MAMFLIQSLERLTQDYQALYHKYKEDKGGKKNCIHCVSIDRQCGDNKKIRYRDLITNP